MADPIFDPEFEHEWQREAWERECEETRKRISAPRPTEPPLEKLGPVLGRLLKRAQASPYAQSERVCKLDPRPTGQLEDGKHYCDGLWHYIGGPRGGTNGRCPEVIAHEVKQRVAEERSSKRLGTILAKLKREGAAATFEGYNGNRNPSAARALKTMQEFAASRPPRCGVMMAGGTGQGKTRLMLASHFELLGAGISSQYTWTAELRMLFVKATSFDEEESGEAKRALERFIYAQVVHFDDAGHIENDERKRGVFAEGIKDLMDRSRGVWAVSTNRTPEELEKHPDIGGAILSRMSMNATLVVMDGTDYRIESMKVAK